MTVPKRLSLAGCLLALSLPVMASPGEPFDFGQPGAVAAGHGGPGPGPAPARQMGRALNMARQASFIRSLIGTLRAAFGDVGVLLLAMAWWLVSPVLPAAVQMMGWAALLVGYGMFLLLNRGKWVAKAVGALALVLGLTQLVGVVSGGRDPLAPLAHLTGKPEQPLAFQRIKTVAQLDALLAQTGGKTVMLACTQGWPAASLPSAARPL